MRYLSLVLIASATFAVGCEQEDIGKLCGTDAHAISEDPVDGEVPAVEVVRMERSEVCESFQCLRHLGLEPYCTRACELNDPSGGGETGNEGKECTSDSDCTRPNYCFEGICRDDDCPKGFWCRQVQEVGPLAQERYCVRRTGCNTARQQDCEDFGEISCIQMGCYDSCLENDADACEYHALKCSEDYESYCACPAAPEGEYSCADAELACGVGARAWPQNSVDRIGVCMQNNPPQ